MKHLTHQQTNSPIAELFTRISNPSISLSSVSTILPQWSISDPTSTHWLSTHQRSSFHPKHGQAKHETDLATHCGCKTYASLLGSKWFSESLTTMLFITMDHHKAFQQSRVERNRHTFQETTQFSIKHNQATSSRWLRTFQQAQQQWLSPHHAVSQ